MSERRLEGIIHLEHSLLVDSTVLGTRFPLQLNDGEAELWFPTLPKDATTAEWHVLESPLPDAPRLAEIAKPGWGRTAFGKHPEHPRPLASWVEMVAFRAVVNVDPSKKPWDYAYNFARQFDPWLAVVYQWIDLWAPNARDSQRLETGTQGHFWDSSMDPEQLTGWSPDAWVTMVRPTAALDAVTLSAAMQRASDDEAPPTEWVFLLRARQADDSRTAVIEAATAVEVALGRCLNDRLSRLSDEARERIVIAANGLVGLLRLMEDIDGVSPTAWKRAGDRLANPRNRAVHSGAEPDDVLAALAEAESILQRYAPLAPPA
jgi:hypothetical protein